MKFLSSVFRMSDGTIVLPSDSPNSASTVWLSEDESRTWDVRRLISDDGPARYLVGGACALRFLMSHSTAEPRGYLSVCQTADGVLHLISSAQHYSFNLAWLKTAPQAKPAVRD